MPRGSHADRVRALACHTITVERLVAGTWTLADPIQVLVDLDQSGVTQAGGLALGAGVVGRVTTIQVVCPPDADICIGDQFVLGNAQYSVDWVSAVQSSQSGVACVTALASCTRSYGEGPV